MDDRLHNLEELVAHLQKQIDELSDVAAKQSTQLDTATRRIEMLMRREAEREADQGGSAAFSDQRPPHY